ncbi:histidine kinase [Epithele typhae]|uniref:histidine kinase n=1 Tax=Epithele typhae TaxID=378194 RepID=UPI002007623D|nr:histidine kinase [Epithele typhae]KAH9912153.1 histidine kinase [Epithele typhae]
MDHVVLALAPERELVRRWAPELVALSYLISWLGAYTSTQIMIHAKYTRSPVLRWTWTFFASAAFGFCAIWSMHFVGMLACRLDVKVNFNMPLTILSAFVAVVFTFTALACPYATESIEHSTAVLCVSRLWQAVVDRFSFRRPQEGYAPLSCEDRQLILPVVADLEDRPSTPGNAPHTTRATPPDGRRPPLVQSRSSTDSSVDSCSTSGSEDSSSISPTPGATTCSSTESWNGPLRHGLSREAHLRIRANANERPVPYFGFQYWSSKYWTSVSTFLYLRAAVWAAAIVFMHYCGLWAMEIPEGRVEWNWALVAPAYAVACVLCFVACLAMNHIESEFGQQIVFSTIASIGCSSVHYISVATATFYTRAAPVTDPGYPASIPVAIMAVVGFFSVVSSVLLAHVAITARNRMAEVILTKRRLWQIMAEKDAAEQAVELKQQFISIASHEIRTPLHTVIGYCELLVRAELTEEQSMYVTSIQQACHAINVIAGNVLDFSKLDRNNAELSAHPVLVDVRKMLEDIAKVTEVRGTQLGSPQVDVMVSVATNVPASVYLDETYAFRILMNLISNAQKFCEEGYICLSATMSGPTQLQISVSDTGCGIPRAFRGALFEPFRQADTSHTRPRQGAGLGLSIVKHLVQRMGGTVSVESTEGEGSTFTVELPVMLHSRPPSRAPSPAYPPAPDASSGPVARRKKLVRVVHRDVRTQKQYLRLWAGAGHAACAGAASATLADLAYGVDAVWTDAETLAGSPALRALMRGSSPSAGSPGSSEEKEAAHVAVFVVHSNAHDLTPLGDDLEHGAAVVLVKRPVVMHAVAEWVDSPEGRMGTHVRQTRVRFALPATGASDTDGDTDAETDDDTDAEWEDLLLSAPVPMPPPAMREKALSRIALPGGKMRAGNGALKAKTAGAVEVIPLSPPSVHPFTVLLVEDNPVNQRLGQRLLEKLGYVVSTANDGQQALNAVRTNEFGCCLMDCQMPVLDGFDATTKIRELERTGALSGRLPIIALTANVSPESEAQCRAVGMDYFLPKPLKMNDLDAIVRRLRRALPVVVS